MFATLFTTARAVTYYLLALVGCAGLALTVPDGHAASVLAMLTPLAAVLLMQLVVTRDGWRRGGWTSLGLGRLGVRVWGIALGLPVAVLAGSEALVRLTGLTSWHLPTAFDGLVLATDLPVLVGFCLLEEIGWRGYLTPLMVASGRRAPHVLTGLLHGIWHLPLVFLTAGGYLADGDRWVVVPVFLGVFAVSGPVYGWLRVATGSVWPAVLAHASFNWALGGIALVVTTDQPDAVAAVGREAGIVTLVLLTGAALWLTARDRAVPAAVPAPPQLQPSA